MQLYIGNKNYSSWSMRPWVLMKQCGIPFEEVMLRFDGLHAESAFKRGVLRFNPTGRVPFLVDGDLVVWDTLAIAEYLAERHAGLWPADAAARARARSVCAEMHAGFSALRQHCAMNIEAELPEVGRQVLADQAGVREDLARIDAMWTELLAQHGGPYLFGAAFTIADAFYAPVCMRLHTYRLPVGPAAAQYVQTIRRTPGVAAWIEQALEEHDFVAFDEPYRQKGSAA